MNFTRLDNLNTSLGLFVAHYRRTDSQRVSIVTLSRYIDDVNCFIHKRGINFDIQCAEINRNMKKDYLTEPDNVVRKKKANESYIR